MLVGQRRCCLRMATVVDWFLEFLCREAVASLGAPDQLRQCVEKGLKLLSIKLAVRGLGGNLLFCCICVVPCRATTRML